MRSCGSARRPTRARSPTASKLLPIGTPPTPIFANDWPPRRGQRRSTPEPRRNPMDNTPNQAIVTVDAAGNVVCTPNPLPANGKNVELKFALQADGYVFPEADALVVSNPGTEFPQPSRTLPPHGTTALLFDRNSE